MKHSRWTDDEVEFLRSNADLMTGIQMADHLARTHSAVQLKAKRLGVSIRHQNGFSSHRLKNHAGQIQVGSRTLIAKTCRGCGRLLPARRFSRHQSGRSRGYWHSSCRACTFSGRYATNKQAELARAVAGRDKIQEYTKSLAFAQGAPWTDANLAVLADTSKSLVEVAVSTGRTYRAVTGRAAKEGIQRRINPDQHKNWIVQLQRASVEVAFDLEPMDSTGIPLEEDWDWNDKTAAAS